MNKTIAWIMMMLGTRNTRDKRLPLRAANTGLSPFDSLSLSISLLPFFAKWITPVGN